MAERKNFRMTWPELGVSVECEPLEINTVIYDWWIENMPIKAVQSHALVSGDLAYCLCAWTPTPVIELGPDEVTTIQMVDAPVGYGALGYSERSGFGCGYIGGIDFVYGKQTEDMPYVYNFKVKDEYIDTIKEVGKQIWEAVYKTNKIITLEVSVVE